MVDFKHTHHYLLLNVYDLGRIFDKVVRHFRHVYQAFHLDAHVDKRAKLRDVRNDTRHFHAFL